MMKRSITSFVFLLFCIFSNFSIAQVGIGTTEPEGILDVVSDTSAMVLPRNTDPDGDDNIAGNDDDGVLVPVEGMIVYDKTDKTVRYFDGTKWQALSAAGNPATSNEGVVKIESGGGSALSKPYFHIVSSTGATYTTDTYYPVSYTTGLNFAAEPTTSWPENAPDQTETGIYKAATGAFFDNITAGQVHIWRVVIDFAKQGSSNYDAYVTVKMENNGDGAQLVTSNYAASTTGVLTFNFITIAKTTSINNGYTISVKCTNKIDLTIESITRVSTYKD